MNSLLEIRAPSEQEGTRSRILRWLKKPGEAVFENDPLVELETDKVTVEVAAPGNGVLRDILKQEQEELAPGELLGRIEQEAIAGTSQSRRESLSPLSPAVRRLLMEHNLDAAAVRGSGQGGRITIEDVMNHAVEHSSGPSGNPVSTPTGRLIPHSAIRVRVAEHMVQSLLQTAPHVTSVFEADLSAVIAHRAHHREAFERRGVHLTFTAYFLAAAVKAIRAVPETNSHWTDTALEIFDHIDIGVATALTTGGLVVPVLRNVESLDLSGIAQGLHDLVNRARDGKLQPNDVRGGTFTISNHGVGGSLLATPIVIHQPQSAILGIGKLEKRAVVDKDDRVIVRPCCYVTLTIDHRVMDGLQANQFLQTFVQTLHAWPL